MPGIPLAKKTAEHRWLQAKYDQLCSDVSLSKDESQVLLLELREELARVRKEHKEEVADLTVRLESETRAHRGSDRRNSLMVDELTSLRKEIQPLRGLDEINESMSRELAKLREETTPLRIAVNSLTAERSKWLRKLKRAGIR